MVGYRIDLGTHRPTDGALSVLGGDFLREHMYLGYTVTVHASQGATVDTCHGVFAPPAGCVQQSGVRVGA